MNESSFIASGGEAIIRGLLSRLPFETVLQRGRLTVLAEGYVVEGMRRKGYLGEGAAPGWLRGFARQVALGMSGGAEAQSAPRDRRVTPPGPYPGQPADSPTRTYTVIVTTNDGAGGESSVLVDVTAQRDLTAGEILTLASRAAEDRVTRGQATVTGGARGDPITTYRILTAYRGETSHP